READRTHGGCADAPSTVERPCRRLRPRHTEGRSTMSTPALDLMEDAITQLRDAGRVSEAAWTVARRVIDLSRGVVPKDQWQTVHQEVVGYGHQLDRTRTPTSDTDRRVSTLLGKSLNGDAQGM